MGFSRSYAVVSSSIRSAMTEFPNGRGGTLSGSTQRKYLEALSGLFNAVIRERVHNGPNPIDGIVKPLESPPSEE
jgi:hypothetical protein